MPPQPPEVSLLPSRPLDEPAPPSRPLSSPLGGDGWAAVERTRGLSTFDSRRTHLHEQNLVKCERDLHKCQQELAKTRVQLEGTQQRARVARETIAPLRRRVIELDANLARERDYTGKLEACLKEADEHHAHDTKRRVESWEAQRQEDKQWWKVREEEHCADVQALEERLQQQQAEHERKHLEEVAANDQAIKQLHAEFEKVRHFARHKASEAISKVRRGGNIRKELQTKKAAATGVQAAWRRLLDRRRMRMLHSMATKLQCAARRKASLRRWHAILDEERQQRLRSVMGSINGGSVLTLGVRRAGR